MKDLKERLWNWKEALECKGSNIRKTKVVLRGSEGELFYSKIDSCGICGRRVMANIMLSTKG